MPTLSQALPASLLVRSHPSCRLHEPGLGHPESQARLDAVLKGLQDPPSGAWTVDSEAQLPPDDDTLGVIKWLHEEEYIERLRRAAEQAPAQFDTPDCLVSSGTFCAALCAAGLAVQAALDMVNNRLLRAFLAVRPPSHHAERHRTRGFCFFNSVALAAELIFRALDRPVLIVDFDVHHGNGTQSLFYDRAEVGYLSVHQYPAFPGTGGGDETGVGAGTGTTRNVPLAAGADDAIFATALEMALSELGSRLQPAAIVVVAGFGGHVDDPVGEMNLTEDGFRRMTTAIVRTAERWSDGRILSLLEGGYHPAALSRCARAHVETLAGVD